MSYCDDQYTKVAKPAIPSYIVKAKPVEKTTASYTVIPQPCLELLAILTENGIEILHEDSRVMITEGVLV